MPVPLTLQELVELVAPNEWPSLRAAIERVDTSRRVREAIRSDIDIRSGGFTAVDPDFAEHVENVLPWSFALEQTALPLLDIVREAVRIAMTEASVKVTGRRDGAAPEPLRRADIMAAEIDLRKMTLRLGDQVWSAVEIELPALGAADPRPQRTRAPAQSRQIGDWLFEKGQVFINARSVGDLAKAYMIDRDLPRPPSNRQINRAKADALARLERTPTRAK